MTCNHQSTTDFSFRTDHIFCHDCKSHQWNRKWIDRKTWEDYANTDPEKLLKALMGPAAFALSVLSDVLQGKIDAEDVSQARLLLTRVIPTQDQMGTISLPVAGPESMEQPT